MATNYRQAKQRSRRGLSRAEVVALLIIAGVLCVLAMMALFAGFGSRAPTSMSRCGTSLRTVGQGLNLYRINVGHWPIASTLPVDGPPGNVHELDGAQAAAKPQPGDRRPRKPSSAGYSWIFALLPYVGEKPLHDDVVTTSNGLVIPPFDPAIVSSDSHVALRELRFLRCPAFAGEGASEYESTAPEYTEFVRQLKAEPSKGVALTNYVALAATHLSLVLPNDGAAAAPNGVIIPGPSGTGIVKVSDGDARTLVVAETCEPRYAAWIDGTTSWIVGHQPDSAPPLLANGRWACEAARGCSISPRAANDDRPPYRQNWPGREPWNYAASSFHQNGAVVHLSAGLTIHRIIVTGEGRIDASVYLALISRDGGENDDIPSD